METIRELIEKRNPKLNDVGFVVDVVLQVAKKIKSNPDIKEVSIDNIYLDGSSVYVGETPKVQTDASIGSKVQPVREERPIVNTDKKSEIPSVNTNKGVVSPPIRASGVSQTPPVRPVSNANAIDTIQTPEPQVVNTDKVLQKDLQDSKDSGIIERERKIVVKSFKTAITVAVSLHKAKPEMYIEIKSDDDYELDLNLVVCTNPTYKGVVIEIGENGEEIFEQYVGKEYSEWREIARIANSRLG
jgi:hypothetical protein